MPHPEQNFAPGASAAWHFGQFVGAAMEAPQFAQNFAPGAAGVWHFGHAAAAGTAAAGSATAAWHGASDPVATPVAPVAAAVARLRRRERGRGEQGDQSERGDQSTVSHIELSCHGQRQHRCQRKVA